MWRQWGWTCSGVMSLCWEADQLWHHSSVEGFRTDVIVLWECSGPSSLWSGRVQVDVTRLWKCLGVTSLCCVTETMRADQDGAGNCRSRVLPCILGFVVCMSWMLMLMLFDPVNLSMVQLWSDGNTDTASEDVEELMKTEENLSPLSCIDNKTELLQGQDNQSRSGLGQAPYLLSIRDNKRLGNLLFQYAAVYGTASRVGMAPVMAHTSTIYQVFNNITTQSINITWPLTPRGGHLPTGWMWVTGVAKAATYTKQVLQLHRCRTNVLLLGNFQSWKFFQHVESDLRAQLVFNDPLRRQAQQILQDTRQGGTDAPPTFVGVHIRRADFLMEKHQKGGFIVSNTTYIRRAMRFYEERFQNIVYVVCTDDKQWALTNVRSERHTVVYSQMSDSASDLCLLSSCNHSIITSGTYSWWSAWLTGGQVVYDRSYPRSGTFMDRQLTREDYYPPQWTGL